MKYITYLLMAAGILFSGCSPCKTGCPAKEAVVQEKYYPAIISKDDSNGLYSKATLNFVYKDGKTKNLERDLAYQKDGSWRLVVTKETMTVEGMIKIVYDLLKDKLNIVKLTFTSGVNAACAEFPAQESRARCPLCGVALNENGVCPKCGWRKA